MSKHVSEVRDDIQAVIDALLTEAIRPDRAKEVINAYGKQLKTYSLQLGYHASRKETPEIAELAAPLRPAK